MGSCVSRSTAAGFGQQLVAAATAMVVDSDGSLAQFAAPVTAHEALSGMMGGERRRESCFVCSSDELYFDAPVRALAAHDALQAGQLYFALPLSALGRPLSGQDMAALAVKASAALGAAAFALLDDAARSASGAESRGKSGGSAGVVKQRRRPKGRVAPLAADSEPAAYTEKNYEHGEHDVYRTVVSGDRTVGKTRTGAGHRSSAARRLARPVQRLSVIVEGTE